MDTNSLSVKKIKYHRCYFCGQKFQEVKLLKRHLITHKDRPFNCEKCELAFTDKATLTKHCLFMHTEERRYVCEFCGRKFVRLWDMKKHQSMTCNKEQNKMSYCSECGKKISVSKSLCANCLKKKTKNGDIKYACTICIEVFDTKDLLDCHQKKHGNIMEEKFKKSVGSEHQISTDKDNIVNSKEEEHSVCQFCSRKFTNNSGAEKYCCVMCNKEQGMTYCPGCREKVLVSQFLCTDCLRTNDDVKYACTICFKAFDSKDLLNCHQQEHTSDTKLKSTKITNFGYQPSNDKNSNENSRDKKNCINSTKSTFLCQTCKSNFNSFSELKKHVLTHSNRKPFNCDKCDCSFKTTHSLYEHAGVHTNYHAYKCETCGLSFKYCRSYEQHILEHSDVRLYTCRLCKNSYQSSSVLKKHMSTVHTDERPFQCYICDRSFKLNFCLKQHLISHGATRAFKCKICFKSFKYPTNYYRHMRLHTGKKLHKCTICNKQCTHASELRIHVISHTKEGATKKNYKCKECGHCFKYLKRFEDHKLIHEISVSNS